jgi:hypothetical protein
MAWALGLQALPLAGEGWVGGDSPPMVRSNGRWLPRHRDAFKSPGGNSNTRTPHPVSGTVTRNATASADPG